MTLQEVREARAEWLRRREAYIEARTPVLYARWLEGASLHGGAIPEVMEDTKALCRLFAAREAEEA